MSNMIKLELNDWKILNQLDLDCRQSDSEIGKKTRISKQVVNYRVKRLIKENIITGFYPLIDISKFGYGAHKIYLKFSSLSGVKEQELWDYLTKQKNIVWAISCSGEWDIIFGIVSKNINEFNDVLSKFMNKYSEHISNRSISVFNQASIHHRKWFFNKDNIQTSWKIGGEIEAIEIDKVDKNILKVLNKNARTNIIDIAEEIKISSSLAIQRIKKLKQKGVIKSFRAEINREKLGILYCKAFIYYQGKTTEKENQLLKYCYNLKEIVGVSQSIGSWDLELEFEVKNYDDFHKIMKEMKNKFPLIKNFNTIYIEKEYGQSFLPEIP